MGDIPVAGQIYRTPWGLVNWYCVQEVLMDGAPGFDSSRLLRGISVARTRSDGRYRFGVTIEREFWLMKTERWKARVKCSDEKLYLPGDPLTEAEDHVVKLLTKQLDRFHLKVWAPEVAEVARG